MSSTAARVRRRLARPTQPVERTRWLFFVIALVSLLLTVPAALVGAHHVQPVLLAFSSLALAVSWTYRYLTRRVVVGFDLLDIVAVTAFALGCAMPAVAFGIVFPAMWFRVMYGRTWRVGLYAVALGAALVGATLGWPLVPGNGGGTDLSPVLSSIPVLGLTFIGARHLALGMLQREQTRGRDWALRQLGTNLLGLTDPRAIRTQGWRAVEEVARMTPDLKVIVVAVDEENLRVVEQTGDLGLTTLPRDLVAGATGEVEETPKPFDGGDTWLRIPLPRFPNHTGLFPGAFMLVGAPDVVPTEAVTALQSLNNQVALAMRSSQAHRDLAEQALTDTLTGLANRAAFTAALDEATVEAEDRTWVLFLDLDDFKVVNDDFGHAAGDQLLRHIGARMLGALRDQDLCARLGGDEFGVLLREAEPDVARRISQRLVELLSAPVTLEGRRVQLGASLGLACLQPGSTASDVVQQADLAMYAAKAAGKNRVQVFSPALVEVSGATLLEAELREAVDRGQFVVHYQPIVDATDGRCLAVEALVRWAHPVRGLLAPAEFLDVAEHTGIGNAIGEQVLRAACAEAAGWPGIALHVNVSPLQLAHPHFVTVVREVLEEHQLGPKQLIIEITESTVLDAPAVQGTLDVLAEIGVGIAVDDFGTGYSALTTLRTLPVDVVKIDKSFVAGAATEDADQAVIEAIAQMADRLGLQTVAEGVEDVDQQDFVRRAGITAVQGRLHFPPVPADEFTAWLTRESLVA
ncbi:putative bifunctional diguanylate cyclase/phosphodiesterase [Petropleomorpha daqingensis]|uniref:Diguanylate cyclase (GGDEF)-like protein n=1 Tax=Petropleomorpha daqingensis TaxID=2026353 RepID=A0A853C780_9ACTN|nr:EAL domain-containing protein [Petropleomorpha daqingensis]NYJ03880.1 diguanylate cyclase (GGDEF)-like protein [Petropleomorpha daqingensis]